MSNRGRKVSTSLTTSLTGTLCRHLSSLPAHFLELSLGFAADKTSHAPSDLPVRGPFHTSQREPNSSDFLSFLSGQCQALLGRLHAHASEIMQTSFFPEAFARTHLSQLVPGSQDYYKFSFQPGGNLCCWDLYLTRHGTLPPGKEVSGAADISALCRGHYQHFTCLSQHFALKAVGHVTANVAFTQCFAQIITFACLYQTRIIKFLAR